MVGHPAQRRADPAGQRLNANGAPKESLFIDFFGRPAATHKGTAAFSLKSGAPIVFVALLRQKDGTHDAVFEEIDKSGLTATVDFFGVRRVVRLELVDEPVAPGDYVLNHVGYAIRRIPEDDIEGTLALYEQLLRTVSDGEDAADLMSADVRGEIQGASSRGPGDD